jgi:uncharacterized damage-inducible protein DinB
LKRVGFSVLSLLQNNSTMESFIENVAPYYHHYIRLVPEQDAMKYFQNNLDKSMQFLSSISEEQSLYAYSPGKWTIKEVLGHMIDAERVFAYRAMRIARNDKTNLPGFEEDDYVAAAHFNQTKWVDLLQQFKNLRISTIDLFASFDEAAMQREGIANDAPTNVKALMLIIAGHEIHHLGVLKERYLKGS